MDVFATACRVGMVVGTVSGLVDKLRVDQLALTVQSQHDIAPGDIQQGHTSQIDNAVGVAVNQVTIEKQVIECVVIGRPEGDAQNTVDNGRSVIVVPACRNHGTEPSAESGPIDTGGGWQQSAPVVIFVVPHELTAVVVETVVEGVLGTVANLVETGWDQRHTGTYFNRYWGMYAGTTVTGMGWHGRTAFIRRGWHTGTNIIGSWWHTGVTSTSWHTRIAVIAAIAGLTAIARLIVIAIASTVGLAVIAIVNVYCAWGATVVVRGEIGARVGGNANVGFVTHGNHTACSVATAVIDTIHGASAGA